MTDKFFVEACLDLAEGDSLKSDHYGVTVHRYHNSWLVLTNNPTSMLNLGRELFSDKGLIGYLMGNIMLGRPILPEKKF